MVKWTDDLPLRTGWQEVRGVAHFFRHHQRVSVCVNVTRPRAREDVRRSAPEGACEVCLKRSTP